MCSCVSLEIERIVETLATERAEISFDSAMAFYMTVEQSLQWEMFFADFTNKILLGFFNYKQPY